VAEQSAEARIRDLERRLDLDPGSRLFVSLAEEYRKLGRHRDALSALQKGLLAHPGYVAAQVALGRVYVEARQTTDAIATFTKVLVADPGNLVAAKSLADIYLARGDNLEAVKKYKLYRALSGDRKVDEVIAHLETLVAPRPVAPARPVVPEAPPPPPKFQETDKSRRLPRPAPGTVPPPPLTEPFEITPLPFEVGEDSEGGLGAEDPFPLLPTRDTPLAPPPIPAPPAGTPPVAASPPPPAPRPAAAPPEEAARPTGRALADLYYAQGHYAEALQVYDDLVARHPFDEDLQRMRRDAEARLLPASASPGSTGDQGLERRLARIRVLRRWLGAVQAG
jgi:tetratricopeptide (TPR) repeat protein